MKIGKSGVNWVLPGQASEFPFGANVRAWSEHNEEVLLLGHFDEGDQIEEDGHVVVTVTEIEFISPGLVEVPRHITTNYHFFWNSWWRHCWGQLSLRFDSVHASGPQLPQAIPPVGRVDPEVVDGTADQTEWLAVEEEAIGSGHQAGDHTAFAVMLVQSGQLSVSRRLQLKLQLNAIGFFF